VLTQSADFNLGDERKYLTLLKVIVTSINAIQPANADRKLPRMGRLLDPDDGGWFDVLMLAQFKCHASRHQSIEWRAALFRPPRFRAILA